MRVIIRRINCLQIVSELNFDAERFVMQNRLRWTFHPLHKSLSNELRSPPLVTKMQFKACVIPNYIYSCTFQ